MNFDTIEADALQFEPVAAPPPPALQVKAETAPPPAPRQDRPTDPAALKRERDRRYRERKRHEKDGAPPKQATEQQPPKAATMDEELAALKAGYTDTPPPVSGAPAPGAQVPGAQLVSGYVLVLVVDALFPALIAWGVNKFGKRDDVTADALRLSQKEKDALEPIADRAASFVLGRVDPVTLFFSVAGAMYLTRIPKNPKPAAPKVSKKDRERTNADA